MIVLVPDALLEELTQAKQAVAPNATLVPYSESGDLPPHLDQAEAMLRWVSGKRFSDLAARAPRLRWLHTASAGVDHILTTEVRAKVGLTVTDSGPAFEIAIPEFVMAWILMTIRNMPGLIANQRAHRWEGVEQDELAGKTIGIIGLGPIGRGVAARAQAFGTRIIGLRRSPDSVPAVDKIVTGRQGLIYLLNESDFVVVAAALTGETRHLIGAKELAHMKQTAWLINIARGSLIDETALVEALCSGRPRGACLDVFEKEPLPGTSPLWDMPNVYIAPHNSPGGSPALRDRQKAIFLDNLGRFARAETLANVVDIERGY